MIVSRITAVLAAAAIGGVVLTTSASAGVLPPRTPTTLTVLESTTLAPTPASCSFTVAKGFLTVHGRVGANARADIAATTVPAYEAAGHFYTSTWTLRVPAGATTARVRVWMGWVACTPSLVSAGPAALTAPIDQSAEFAALAAALPQCSGAEVTDCRYGTGGHIDASVHSKHANIYFELRDGRLTVLEVYPIH